jgi:hypothetical protein
MLATDYGIDGGYESKGKVHFEVGQRSTTTKLAKFRFLWIECTYTINLVSAGQTHSHCHIHDKVSVWFFVFVVHALVSPCH